MGFKKSALKPWRQECWCIPPKQNAAFVAAMEDVLEVYQRPVDDARPLVCLDEFAKQLPSESRTLIAATRQHAAGHDYECVRERSVSGFILAMPHLGGRDVFIGKDGPRTAKNFAACLDYLANHVLPEADKIVLVMDNINTHKEASPYEAFPPVKARELFERFGIHDTPKPGSWLNMAEIETGLRVRGCLDRRIGSEQVFRREVAAYLVRKNENPNPINWQFTDEKARTKLKSPYPAV